MAMSRAGQPAPVALVVALVALAFGAPSAAESEAAEPAPPRGSSRSLRLGPVELRPDFKLYVDWQMDLGSEERANAFHVTRAYLGVHVGVLDWLGGRVTFDVGQATDLGASGPADVEEGEAEVGESRLQGSLVARLKYGYLRVGVPRLGLEARFGVIQTPWIDWMEHIEGSRFLRRILVEEEYHYPSADFGLALAGRVGDWVTYQVGVYNGEGYHGLEDSEVKDVIGRVSIRPAPHVGPLECLQASGYVQAELPPPQAGSEETHRRFGGALTFRLAERVSSPDCSRVEGERLAAWLQAFYGEEGRPEALVGTFGLSAGARVELPRRFFLLGRLDRFDADLAVSSGERWTILAVIGYRVVPEVVVALDYQGRLEPGERDRHLLGVHAELHL